MTADALRRAIGAGVWVAVLACLVWGALKASEVFQPGVDTLDVTKVAAALAALDAGSVVAMPADAVRAHGALKEACLKAHGQVLRPVVLDLITEQVLDRVKLRAGITAADLNSLLGAPISAGGDPATERCGGLLVAFSLGYPELWPFVVKAAGDSGQAMEDYVRVALTGDDSLGP